MKKINNKGFLLVETLVVSTFCITVLVLLYLQFRDLLITYNNSYKYNTNENIYTLNTVKKYLDQNNKNNQLNVSGSSSIISISNNNSNECSITMDHQDYCNSLIKAGNFKRIILINKDLTGTNNLSEGMKSFINKLQKNNNPRLIAEFKDGTFAAIDYK